MAYSLKSSPGHLLRRAQQYAHDLYSQEVSASGPTPRQFEVLHVVSKNEGLSQTDLVRHTGIDRSTLADMIARMMKKGLLSRKRTREDARANAVSITASGRRMLKSAESKVNKSDKAVLAVLPKTQQSTFMKALKAYAEALDKMDAATAAPTKKTARKKTAKRKTAKKKTAKRKTAKRKTAKRKTRRR